MNTLLAILSTASLAAIALRTSARPVLPPPSPAEREAAWRARLDEEIGLESEEYLSMLARGIAAKRWLLTNAHAGIPRHRALVPAGPLVIIPQWHREPDPERSTARLRDFSPARGARIGQRRAPSPGRKHAAAIRDLRPHSPPARPSDSPEPPAPDRVQLAILLVLLAGATS